MTSAYGIRNARPVPNQPALTLSHIRNPSKRPRKSPRPGGAGAGLRSGIVDLSYLYFVPYGQSGPATARSSNCPFGILLADCHLLRDKPGFTRIDDRSTAVLGNTRFSVNGA